MIQPLGDRVVVQPVPEGDQTVNGVYLPQGLHDTPRRGTVLAVGPGTPQIGSEAIPVGCKQGDVVLFSHYAGTPITVDDQDVVVLREGDVLALIPEEG